MDSDVKIDWHQRAKVLKIDGRAVINGKRVNAADNSTFECFSPIDNRKLCDVASGKSKDIDLAVAAARAAFSARTWAGLSPKKRKQRAAPKKRMNGKIKLLLSSLWHEVLSGK